MQVQSMVTFHWLSYGSPCWLSSCWARRSLPPAEVVEQCHFPPKRQGTSLPVGISGVWLHDVRVLSSSLSTPFQMRFLFINFQTRSLVLAKISYFFPFVSLEAAYQSSLPPLSSSGRLSRAGKTFAGYRCACPQGERPEHLPLPSLWLASVQLEGAVLS